MTVTKVPLTKSSDVKKVLTATDASTLTNATVVTLGGVTNTLGEFVKHGVVRITSDGSYTHHNDSIQAMLGVQHDPR